MTKQELIKELELLKLQNKILKDRLSFESCMLDNVSAEYDSLQNFIKELKYKLREFTILVFKFKHNDKRRNYKK